MVGLRKKQLLKNWAQKKFVDFTKTNDLVAAVQEATNGGPHGVINVSVSDKAMGASVQYVRPTGKVVLVGLPADAVVKTDVFSHVVKSIKIIGSYVGNRADTREAIDYFTRGLVHSPIKVVGLSQLGDVYKLMEQGKIVGRYVLDTAK